jgi:hypothetical protein
MVEDLEEIISEYLKYLRPLKRIVLSLSPIALLFGFSEFLIYSTFIVKDPFVIVKDFYLFKTLLFYYIFALTLFLIIFIVFLLAAPLYFLIEENNSKEGNSKEGNRLLQILKKFYLSIKKSYFLFIYIIIIIIFTIFHMAQSGFSIFPIIGYNMPIWFNILSSVLFIPILYPLMKDLLQRIIIARGKDRIKAIFSFIIYTIPTIVIIYTSILIIKPFQLSKLGYFEANLTLEKEYVEKLGLKTYLEERCKIKCLDESSNDNYCRTSKLFIFLRTDSEYIVGCSKDSNVRIHIPVDKVIAIEYIEDSKEQGSESGSAPTTNHPSPTTKNK